MKKLKKKIIENVEKIKWKGQTIEHILKFENIPIYLYLQLMWVIYETFEKEDELNHFTWFEHFNETN